MKAKILTLIMALGLIAPSFAFNAANPYWFNLKPKLVKYLKANINPSVYQYTILGPNKEMKNFLGNRTDANIKFSNLNLSSNSHRKTVVASAYDDAGRRIESISINIDVLVYKKVFMLRHAVARGQEVLPNNVYQSTIPIKATSHKLYFDGIVKQKVASRDIPAATAIMKNMLRHEKIIQAGDTIQVSSGNAVIKLEFMCKAMTSGDLGETITLNCPDMQTRTKKAKVLSQGKAELI